MDIQVYNIKGEVVGKTTLAESIFARPWNDDLVHQVVVAQAANARHPWAHAKVRSEVSGGGKKPWRQKGTGRARHGSIRSPIWKGGGVTHGPRKDRDYTQKVNTKMKRAALYTVLSRKVKDGDIRVIDSLALETPKTKTMMAVLKVLCGGRVNALVIPAKTSPVTTRVARNIPHVKSLAAGSLNAMDVLAHRMIVVDQQALAEIK